MVSKEIQKEIQKFQEILVEKQRRLHQLELQQAQQGYSSEPKILLEIDDLKTDITELNARIAALSLSSDKKAVGSVSVLPSPLTKYDDFFRRLFKRSEYWGQDKELFKQRVVSSLCQAAKAENAFIVFHTGDTWEASLSTSDEKLQLANDYIAGNSQIRQVLDRSSKYYKETKIVNKDIYTNVLHARLQPNDQLCIIAIFPNTDPLHMLVLMDVKLDFEVDTAFSTVINSMFRTTKNFSNPISPLMIESAVYNAIRTQLGYVSDHIYAQQFKLFTNRLRNMTVYFEPIVELAKVPYIWRWEALARDPDGEPKKAPVDLFETAELWGRHFQLELDIHFLMTAIDKYGQGLTEIGVGATQQIVRRSDLPPLHVNVYPESIMRRLYRETMMRVEQEKNFPLSKLVLEISEKMPFPLPDNSTTKEEDMKWFREQLKHYTDQGVGFAIDDFGVGHASTSRLSRIEPEFVKIDRDALLHHLGGFTLEYARNLVSESIGKMKMIVEGFDDQSKFSLAQLYDLKIRFVQGHVLGRAREYMYYLSKDDEKRIAALCETA